MLEDDGAGEVMLVGEMTPWERLRAECSDAKSMEVFGDRGLSV